MLDDKFLAVDELFAMHYLNCFLGLLMSSVVNESIVFLEVKAPNLTKVSELFSQVVLTSVVVQLGNVDLSERLWV